MFVKINSFVFFLVLMQSVLAQEKSGSWEIKTSIGITSKPIVIPTAGDYPIGSGNLPSFQLEADYRSVINKNWSLSSGIGLWGAGTKINTNYPVGELNPASKNPYMVLTMKEYVFMLSVPVAIQYKINPDRPIAYYVDGGIKFNYSLMGGTYQQSHSIILSNFDYKTVFEQNSDLKNNGRPWVSITLGGGLSWKMKNSAHLRTGLQADISFSNIASGDFNLTLPGGEETYGKFKNTLSSVSLVLGYELRGRKTTLKTPQASSNYATSHIEKDSVLPEPHKKFKRTHYSLNINGLYCFPTKINTSSGENILGSSGNPGFGVAGNIFFHLHSNFSIITGLQATIVGRNFELQMDKKRFTPNLDESIDLRGRDTYVPDLVLGVPIGIEKRWLLKKTSYISMDAGAAFNYFTVSDFEVQEVHGRSNNSPVTVATINLNNDAKLIGSAFLRLGYNKILRNQNIARIELLSNFAFNTYFEGDFSIYDSAGTISTGTCAVNGNYIGLGYHYIFTRSKNK